jgi:predicted lipid-binding transport protein (Tim44 family)
MLGRSWLKGFLILFTLIFVGTFALQLDAWARAGGGRSSMGSRGSRSGVAPRPYTAPSPTQPTRPGYTTPVSPTTPLGQSQPSSFWRSFGGGMLGGLAGGFLFRSLFGGSSAYGGQGGGGGGIGLFDILILAAIGYGIYWYIKKKRQEEALTQGGYQSAGVQTIELPSPSQPPYYDHPPAASGPADLAQGLAYIRQADPAFDEREFQDQCMDLFFKIQGAWANRDMSSVRPLLTDEMYRLLQADAEKLKAEKRINHLENIAVRSVDPTEAWQEAGQDYITVRMYANLLDYVTDETTGAVVSGSKTEPVKFEEYWTLTRPVGNNPWQLSAIQQAG